MSAVIAAARECLGTPFKHQGRVVGIGMDCAGLLVHCFKALGVDHFDEFGYPRNPYDGQLEKILDLQPSLRRIDLTEVQAGDVLAMRLKSAPQHIAIHTGLVRGHPYVLHASELHGRVVEHRLDELWGSRVMRAYRLEVSA